MQTKNDLFLIFSMIFLCATCSKEKDVWDLVGTPCNASFGSPSGHLAECYESDQIGKYLLVCRDTSWTIDVVDCYDYCISFGSYDGHCNPYIGGHHCTCECNPSYFTDYCLDSETQVYCNERGYMEFQTCDDLWCGERAYCDLGKYGEDCYCPDE